MSDRESRRSSPVATALADVRVVEWGDGMAIGYAAHLLRDFGAEVTRVSRGGSGAARSGSAAAFLDTGKAVWEPDVATDDGCAAFLALLESADLLIDDVPHTLRERLGFDRDALAARFPRLVQVSVTPFGSDGPYRDFRAGDLELAYLSGLAHLTPRDVSFEGAAATPPLKMPGSLVSLYAGASAAGAALTALWGREHGHAGRHADVSMLETLIPTLRRELALFQYEGKIASRFMRVWRLAPWGVKRCRDGYVFLQVVERHHWEGLVEMMGDPEWARDTRLLDPDYRFEHRDDIEARMVPWLATQDRARFAWESQRRALPFAPVNEVTDLLRIPQLHDRGFFRAVEAGDGHPCLVPGAPYVLTEARHRPVQSQHVSAEGRSAAASEPQGPLSGLRIIDFGHVWAGPYCTALLADMGAEVIKIESERRLDVHRRQGPYAERKPGINRSGVWNAQNRGKRSVTLNLATDRGSELARSLVRSADVVVENFAPGVMRRLGLDFATLTTHKPDLVMASLSAFGQTGPQRGYVGYGPSLDAWAGLDALTAYPDRPPNALGGIFPDTGSALHAAVAIIAALRHRDRTGHGTYIDLSELEVSVLLLGDLVTRALNGEPVPATGNACGVHSPQGAYRCVGDDTWLALSIVDDASWAGLCRVLARDDWMRDASLSSPQERRARMAEIDSEIAAWTMHREPLAAMRALQAAGVPCGMAHTAASLLADPHLDARGFFATLDHPDVGKTRVYAPIWRVGGPSRPFDRPAPILGGDNDDVLSKLLNLSADEIASLRGAGVIH